MSSSRKSTEARTRQESYNEKRKEIRHLYLLAKQTKQLQNEANEWQ